VSAVRFWTLAALGCGLLLALFAWGFAQWHLGKHSAVVSERLLLLGELRRGAVQRYFSTVQAELRFWSSSQEIIAIQSDLLDVWQREGEAASARLHYVDHNPHPAGEYRALDDAGDGSRYSELHRGLHEAARLFVTERGYYNFFLISPGGDIMYSVEKDDDFATSLVDGPYADTWLGRVFRRAREGHELGVVALSDMQSYAPSHGAPAMFIATALRAADGRFLGVLAFELPTDELLHIMNYAKGMGDSGETYLVGPDLLMRSDSRFSETSTVLQQSVATASVERALAGEQGVDVVEGYRGESVMSAYLPLPVGGRSWALMAEMDTQEIAREAARERPSIAGILAFIYGLSLWTLWYWRLRYLPEGAADAAMLNDLVDSPDSPLLDA